MKPHIDFELLKPNELRKLLSQAQQPSAETLFLRAGLEPVLEEFMTFVTKSREAVRQRLESIGGLKLERHMSFDYDPAVEKTRFLKETWDAQSDIWAIIETMPTYYLTMLTFLEKIQIPADKHLRMVSIGTGPGLYETFLGKLFGQKGIGGVITCVDFSTGMTDMHKFILSSQQSPIRNVEPITANMAQLPLPDKSADVVLCNNSLQWCMDWRKAIKEMARILDPSRNPMAYFVIHTHGCAMKMGTLSGEEPPVKLEAITTSQIFDELERNMFTINTSRQLRGGEGSGQLNGSVHRQFVTTRFTPEGIKHQWRKIKPTVGEANFIRFK
jgi:SAM-dependent methyltransferase